METQQKKVWKDADWAMLLFITGITHVKLYFKIAAVVFYLCYVLYNKYKTGKLPGFSKFYFIMPVIGTVSAIVNHSFESDNYWFGYINGVFSWVLAGLSSYLLFLAVTNLPRHKVISTLKMFFLINGLVSFGELIVMIIQSGQLIPYWYWEPTEYYGGSTGDHVKGILSNISVANATINALGVVYFIYNKELKWAALCMIVLLLCTSNVTLILLIVLLAGILVLAREKKVKANTLVMLLIISVVYPFLSYNNIKYVETVYDTEVQDKDQAAQEKEDKKLGIGQGVADYLDYAKTGKEDNYREPSHYRMRLNDSILLSYKDELKYIAALGLIESKSNSNVHMESDSLKKLIRKWYGVPYDKTPLAKEKTLIKIYTVKQTLHYLVHGKKNFLLGAGIGNFSSKQAIKTTGLGLQGSYPISFIYISPDFLRYHLYSLLYVFSMPISEHSVINMPNSVYNQIAGEYGALGILAFLVFYIGYILKHFRSLKAGRYLVLIGLLFFGFEYWFEMLSLTIILELLLFLDIYNTAHERAE
jgi:hypothetical protein